MLPWTVYGVKCVYFVHYLHSDVSTELSKTLRFTVKYVICCKGSVFIPIHFIFPTTEFQPAFSPIHALTSSGILFEIIFPFMCKLNQTGNW